MRYHGYVIRPPSEAASLIVQVMYGCSHGDCAFCGSYIGKPFRVRPFAEVEEDIRTLPPGVKQGTERVFLCDGDALALPNRRMVELLDLLTAELPRLTRVSAYANAHSLIRLTDDELRLVRAHGLELLYVGLESGDEETLARVCKGVTVAQQVEAMQKAKRTGFDLSVTAILGLGGKERSLEHARATGKALSQIDPEYIGVLSLMIEPGTQIAELASRGEFAMPDPLGLLRELREMIAACDVTRAIFRTNHASNYLPLGGTLPRDKERLVRALDEILASPAKARLRPDHLRAL
jgi:radical SAM superfamily enzyme YgiQ (UPF0313 family)